jgi:Domain of unknown function (DUF4276)
MTRFLSLALFAEGPTDANFLMPVLYRTTFAAAARVSTSSVEIPETFIRGSWPKTAQTREDKVEAAFGQFAREGAVNLLFIHADGGAEADRAMAQQVAPSFARLASLNDSLAQVAVIPIRETEAWALADTDALRHSLGTKLSPLALGLPTNEREVENISDPKAVLRHCLHSAERGRRGRSRGKSTLIPPGLGNTVDLQKLYRVAAYAAMAATIESELRRIWQAR